MVGKKDVVEIRSRLGLVAISTETFPYVLIIVAVRSSSGTINQISSIVLVGNR